MKTILITGASRGLGKEIANEFSQNGWSVISGLRPFYYEGKLCSQKGRGGFDVTDRKSIHDALKGIEQLDAVINNAGINKDQLLFRTSEEDWNRIVDVNLIGVFNVCREAVKIMRKNGGHIINISSIAGLKGREGQCHYSASKAGIIGFSKSLAKEVARWNIKVNVILPGYMKTGMLTDEIIKRAEKENLLGRINQPCDIARFIYQLVQTDFISGQVFNLDSRII